MMIRRLLPLVLACALPLAASAQWMWIDKDGRKVFSDQSPPADVPAKNILKHPAGKSRPAEPEVATAAPVAAKPAASAPRISGKDKELLEKKKQAETAQAEEKKAAEEKVAAERSENCDRIRRSKATYDSGVRVALMNAKGEREYMDDAGRAAESRRLQGMLDKECKSP